MYDILTKAPLHRLVELSYCTDAEDALPAVLLLEDVEHLVLSNHRSELMRVGCRRYTQQQTVVVLFQPEEVEL